MYNKNTNNTNNNSSNNIIIKYNKAIYDLPFDILENILYFTDIYSIKKFFQTCKSYKSIYHTYDKQIKHLIIKQILDYFNITPKSNLFKCNCKSLKTFLCIQLKSLYIKFYEERLVNIPDILIYILQNEKSHIALYEKSYNNKLDNNHYSALCEYLLNLCKIDRTNYTFDTYTPPLRNHITNHDLKYILLASNNIAIIHIMLDQYKIDSELLYNIIYDITVYYYHDNSTLNNDKLQLFINHFIYKKCFKWMNKVDNIYFHKILKAIISLRDNTSKQILQNIIDKQYQYNIKIDYNTLFMSCIEFDNEMCLKVICDNSKTPFQFESIDTDILYNFICIGEFNTILYVISIFNESLNSNIYLNIIKKGLVKLSNNDKPVFNKSNLSKLMLINSVLSSKNIYSIQQHIDKYFN